MVWDPGNPWNAPPTPVYVQSGYDVAETNQVIANYDKALANLRDENAKLKKALAEKTEERDKMHRDAIGLHDRIHELKRSEQASLTEVMRQKQLIERLTEARDDWKMQCHVNYGEKKALYDYARKLRIFAENATPIDPILHMGNQGNFIREKMRDAGKKVYDAGGDVHAVARAVTAEMWRNLPFEAPSPERLEVVNAARREVLAANPAPDDGQQYSLDEQIKRCPNLAPV